MLNRSNNDSLDSLLLAQAKLNQVASGDISLKDMLPDLLLLIAETVGSQDGRLDLFTQEPGEFLSIIISDGRTKTRTARAAPDPIKEEIEQFRLLQERYRYIENTQKQDSWFAAMFPGYTSGTWSAVVLPIMAEESVTGCLTLAKPVENGFLPEDIVSLMLYASHLGTAIANQRLRENLRTAELRAEELVKDSSNVAAILVHDLQGPLGNVVTSLEMLQATLNKGQETGTDLMIDIAVRSTQHLQSLVNSILDISRLEAGHEIADREPLAISDLLAVASEVEGPVLEQRQVMLASELSPDLPAVSANSGMIQRVLLNLIDNALKVSEQGQIITIYAAVDEDDRFIKVCVSDQGPGIPAIHRERIFEKYQQLDELSSSKGLGLGLAFCKLAVEAHGGEIWVEDNPGQGACICFTLPADGKATLSA